MSEDLKTLKELKDYLLTYDRFGNTKEVEYCNKDVLRAEAIKHCNNIAKECWFKNAAEYIEKKQGQDTSDACGLHIIEWIMRFFNISEKDIKRSVEG